MRRKKLKKSQLNSDEMSGIITSVSSEKLSHKEAAIKHGVSPRLVQSLTSASKRDPEFLNKTRDKEDKRRLKLRAVISESAKHLNSKPGLLNSQQIVLSVSQEHNIQVSK